MQTFVPLPDPVATSELLDYRRLGKQRVECIQILNALEGRSAGWRNHPATLMWEGHTRFLKYYTNCMINEWTFRGYKNTIPLFPTEEILPIENSVWEPYWWGSPELHASHRSNLLRKDFIYYSKFRWKEPTNLPYVWPVSPLLKSLENL